jgi:hypothetical protein
MYFIMGSDEEDKPFNFEDFKHDIDTRGGYLNGIATSAEDIEDNIQEELDEARFIESRRKWLLAVEGIRAPQFVHIPVAPPRTEEWLEEHAYEENHQSPKAIELDELLPIITEIVEKGVSMEWERFTVKKRQRSSLWMKKEGCIGKMRSGQNNLDWLWPNRNECIWWVQLMII